MSLAINCCKLINARISNVYKFKGYISRSIVTIDDYKIKWKRPEKITSLDPRQTGDLGLDLPAEPTEIKLYYRNSKELEDANDLIKKLYSLEFNSCKEIKKMKTEKAIGLVQRHICDRGSPEVKIAAMTIEIQYLQKYMEQHPRNKRTKVFLKELIDKRKRLLKYLRRWDYKRFEWLLERLNLVYKPQPSCAGMVSRKDSLRKLTQIYCDDIVQQKLDALKAEIEKEKKIFYVEKAEKLALILKDEKEYGLTPTVTEEEVEAARKKVEELMKEDV